MRVLIVDDEIIIREGLRNLINWEKAGFQNFEEAENAVEAIEKIEAQKPDLIITDIFMPEMSGIEFARKVKENYPDIRFLILTGYEKFEYAKEAIEIGVSKYLIKPIFPDELKQIVTEIHNEIIEERKTVDWRESAYTRLKEYKPIIIEKFWSDIIHGNITESHDISERASLIDIETCHDYFLCMAIKLNLKSAVCMSGKTNTSLLKFAISNIFNELLNEEILYFGEYSKNILCCVLKKEINYDQLKLAYTKIGEYMELRITIGIGRTCDHISKINSSAKDAIEVVNALQMIDGGEIAGYQELLSWKKDSFTYPYLEEKELLDTIRYGDKIDTDTFIPFIQTIKKQTISTEMVKLIFYQLLISIYRLANEFNVTSIPEFHDSYARLVELETINDVVEFFKKLSGDIMTSKTFHHSNFVEKLIEKATMIIDENYRDSTLSVKEIAGQLHLNPNYFSNIFAKKMGITCVEYITKKRLEEAKRRLAYSSMKNYDIAEQIGYSNPHYFSYLFKKNVGMSPSEYRERFKV